MDRSNGEPQLGGGSVERLDARDFFERVLDSIPDLDPALKGSLLDASQNPRRRVEAFKRSIGTWASG